MRTTGINHSELDSLSEILETVEEYLTRVRVRGRYPLQTDLDLIRIAYAVGQIKVILHEVGESTSVD